jgi:hypothetical protein
VRHRNRRILRDPQYGPATLAELSEALDIPIDPSLYRRLKKLRRERAVLTENGRVYITGRGREMAREGYVPRARREHLSDDPGPRVRIPSQHQIDALVRAIATARASPNPAQARKPPAAPPAYLPAPPSLPPADPLESTAGQDPSELGGVPVGSGLWLMPDGSYVLSLT